VLFDPGSLEWGRILLLVGVGTIAGVLNVLAGGGSLLTLPVLIFLGLPPTMANGTNRIAILMQNIVAVSRFHQKGKMPWKVGVLCAVPAMVGSVLGARLAVTIDESLFRQILALVMLMVVVIMVIDPAKRIKADFHELSLGRSVLLVLIFFFIGIYGGFIQAGIGFLIITVLLVQGLDLVRINAVKVLVVLCYIPLALFVFIREGQVDFQMGIALAAGNGLGAWLGAHLAVTQGHGFIRKVVIVLVVVFAVRLFWS